MCLDLRDKMKTYLVISIFKCLCLCVCFLSFFGLNKFNPCSARFEKIEAEWCPGTRRTFTARYMVLASGSVTCHDGVGRVSSI